MLHQIKNSTFSRTDVLQQVKQAHQIIETLLISNTNNNNNDKDDVDFYEHSQINVPLFMPQSRDCMKELKFTKNTYSDDKINVNDLNDAKLKLVYNYARQCLLLSKTGKEAMIDWSEKGILKHNNYSCNTSNNWNAFSLDKGIYYIP